MVCRLFPGINPVNVWQMEYGMWRRIAKATDMLVTEAEARAAEAARR